MHAAVSSTQKTNCKIENLEAKESLLKIMRHASYSKRYKQA